VLDHVDELLVAHFRDVLGDKRWNWGGVVGNGVGVPLGIEVDRLVLGGQGQNQDHAQEAKRQEAKSHHG
jgi:hypothetical protein